MKEKLYNTRETAELLNITVQTLWEWAKRNKIEYVKIGSRYRFQKSTIEKMLTPHAIKQS
jgi:excisionase family DNA binding protein